MSCLLLNGGKHPSVLVQGAQRVLSIALITGTRVKVKQEFRGGIWVLRSRLRLNCACFDIYLRFLFAVEDWVVKCAQWANITRVWQFTKWRNVMLQGKLSVSFQNGSESRIHHRLKDTLKDVLKSSSDPLNFGFILLRGLKNQFDRLSP